MRSKKESLFLTACINTLQNGRCWPGAQLREKSVPKRLQQVSELKRFANEALDFERADCAHDRLLAVSAGQNHSYVRASFRGFGENLAARRSRNGHVEKDHIDLASVEPKNFYSG